MLDPKTVGSGSCLIILHSKFQLRDYQFQFLSDQYFKKGFIRVGFLFPGDSAASFNLIQSITTKITQNIGATGIKTKWSPFETIYKFDINYKNLTKIEKKNFLNSYYLLSIYQLQEDDTVDFKLNFTQMRKELEYTNSVEYPKEAFRIKPSNNSFLHVN